MSTAGDDDDCDDDGLPPGTGVMMPLSSVPLCRCKYMPCMRRITYCYETPKFPERRSDIYAEICRLVRRICDFQNYRRIDVKNTRRDSERLDSLLPHSITT